MQVYLENQGVDGTRRYAISIQLRLLGGADLVCQWGRIGQPGTAQRSEKLASLEEAEQRAVSLIRQRLARGYLPRAGACADAELLRRAQHGLGSGRGFVSRWALAARVARKSGLPHDETAKVVQLVFESLGSALVRGETVSIRGFGRLVVRQRRARRVHHPRTGAPLELPARRTAVFKAGKDARDRLSRADPQTEKTD